MIKHVVMFQFKGTWEQKQKIAKKFRDALVVLPEHIETLESIEVGINDNKNEKWDLVLEAVVKDEIALMEYANHPLHLEAVSIIKDHKTDRACVDYKI